MILALIAGKKPINCNWSERIDILVVSDLWAEGWSGMGWGDQWYSFPILGTTTHQYPPTRRKPKLLPKTTKSCHKRSLPLGRGTLFGENGRYCKHSDFLSWVLGYCTSAQANWHREILLLNVLWHLVFKLKWRLSTSIPFFSQFWVREAIKNCFFLLIFPKLVDSPPPPPRYI